MLLNFRSNVWSPPLLPLLSLPSSRSGRRIRLKTGYGDARRDVPFHGGDDPPGLALQSRVQLCV